LLTRLLCEKRVGQLLFQGAEVEEVAHSNQKIR
jgi:hypothetical protein